jgi:hypothetical protein
MPGRPILRDAFARGMVFSAALVLLGAGYSMANWACLGGRTTG